MRFAIPATFVFTGTFSVEAESETQAKEYVDQHCGMVLGGGIHSSIPGEEVDWDFPVHPEKVIGGALRVV
jgi:hypothetical protein